MTLEELIDYDINDLINSKEGYPDNIYRWQNQPEYVEVWYEKQAMSDIFRSILQGYHVIKLPMRGNDSLSNLWEAVNRITQLIALGKNVHILYFGDFDSSGDYMDEDLMNRIRRYFAHPQLKKKNVDFTNSRKIPELKLDMDVLMAKGRLDFHRVAVTKEQIRKYKLPHKPDKAMEQKLMRDNKTPRFPAGYHKLIIVELDTLPARIPNEFRRITIDAVEENFHEDIYQELFNEYTQEDIDKLITDKIEEAFGHKNKTKK